METYMINNLFEFIFYIIEMKFDLILLIFKTFL